MNEELKALLGDSYKENMTLEDVAAFFKGKKFADLSTGKYFYFQAFKKAASKYGGTLGGLSIGDNDNVLGF
jgi:hypothetical protein